MSTAYRLSSEQSRCCICLDVSETEGLKLKDRLAFLSHKTQLSLESYINCKMEWEDKSYLLKLQ